MKRRQARSTWRAYLRHRYRAHVQGWLGVAVGLVWAYYVDRFWHEPLWAVLPAAFVAAFLIVALHVAVAALLRFPWWLLAPLTFVSLALEWALRRLLKRPWHRTPQPRERALSNPFALWQGWRIKRQRWGRQPEQQPARDLSCPSEAMSSMLTAAHPKHANFTWAGTDEYVAAAFEVHWNFWFFSAPVWIGLWLWLIDGQNFLVSVILAIILSVIFSLVLVIPLAAALLALLSTLIVAAGMSPLQRIHAATVLREAHAVQSPSVDTAPATAPPKQTSWVIPLLIGLWLGAAWGDDR